MNRFSKLCWLLVCLLCCTSCSPKALQHIEVGYDIPTGIENLDPQFSTDPMAGIAFSQVFEGLVVSLPNGTIAPGNATKWEVSADGLSYTFSLREQLFWVSKQGKEAPITSADYLFTFQRIFSPQVPSPFARDYLAIQNAQAVLAGTAPLHTLGVTAPDPHTFCFTLEQPDEFFLNKLAQPPALPCPAPFFNETQGRYGLTPDLLWTNGVYKLDMWDNTNRITFSRNSHYRGGLRTNIDTLYFFIARTDTTTRFLDGITDVIIRGQADQAAIPKRNREKYPTITWSILFSTQSSFGGSPFLRKAIAQSINRAQLPGYLPTHPATGGLLQHSATSALPYEINHAKQNYKAGLSVLGDGALSPLAFYVPQEEAYLAYFKALAAGWRTEFGLTIELIPLPLPELWQVAKQGDFDLIALPLHPEGNAEDSLLTQFTSDSKQNYGQYHNPIFDTFVNESAAQITLAAKQEKQKQAETLLLTDAIVIPLFIEYEYYIFQKSISPTELTIYPNSRNIRFAGIKEPKTEKE